MLSRWLPGTKQYRKRSKERFKENILRMNKYNKFWLINSLVEKLWNNTIDDGWCHIYDALLHINTLYVLQLESPVRV